MSSVCLKCKTADFVPENESLLFWKLLFCNCNENKLRNMYCSDSKDLILVEFCERLKVKSVHADVCCSPIWHNSCHRKHFYMQWGNDLSDVRVISSCRVICPLCAFMQVLCYEQHEWESVTEFSLSLCFSTYSTLHGLPGGWINTNWGQL